jgi:hypothetical protein
LIEELSPFILQTASGANTDLSGLQHHNAQRRILTWT